MLNRDPRVQSFSLFNHLAFLALLASSASFAFLASFSSLACAAFKASVVLFFVGLGVMFNSCSFYKIQLNYDLSFLKTKKFASSQKFLNKRYT